MWRPKKIHALVCGVAVVSAAASSAGTYFAVSKKIETKYAQIADEEIRKARKHYTVLPAKPDPEDLAKQYEDEPSDPAMVEALTALKQYTGARLIKDDEPAEEEVPDEPVEYNVFARTNQFWDEEVEASKRNEIDPYIVTHEEFYQNEPDHVQMNLTYFEADDQLADGQDAPIEDIDNTVGSESLSRFGAGSGDPNVVYVRNPRMELDFEIALSKGSYAEEVHGIIQHDDRRIRKFRNRDD